MTLPDPATLIAAGLTLAATVAGGVKLGWAWMTGLIDRFQAEAVKARADFLEEAKAARADFLGALRELEGQRQSNDTKVQESLAGLHAILAERGIPGPAHPGA